MRVMVRVFGFLRYKNVYKVIGIKILCIWKIEKWNKIVNKIVEMDLS